MNLVQTCSDTLQDGPFTIEQDPVRPYVFTVQCTTKTDKQRLDGVLRRKLPATCRVDVVVKSRG